MIAKDGHTRDHAAARNDAHFSTILLSCVSILAGHFQARGATNVCRTRVLLNQSADLAACNVRAPIRGFDHLVYHVQDPLFTNVAWEPHIKVWVVAIGDDACAQLTALADTLDKHAVIGVDRRLEVRRGAGRHFRGLRWTTVSG